MQIAVCDDEKVYLDCLSRKIKACFKELEIEISLDKYLHIKRKKPADFLNGLN